MNMLYWKSNFQIPDSGVQSSEVYVKIDEQDRNLVIFYSDEACSHVIFDKKFSVPLNVNPYEYLLSLEYFAKYSLLDKYQ